MAVAQVICITRTRSHRQLFKRFGKSFFHLNFFFLLENVCENRFSLSSPNGEHGGL